jgi:hydrogenase maturation protein HypF
MRPVLKLVKNDGTQRLRVVIRGAVQGVGFRPFVYRLARELDLTGWVNNSSQGVFLEVEGPQEDLNAFVLRLQRENPPLSVIQTLESSFLPAEGFSDFQIRSSENNGSKTAIVLPDIATCEDCLAEIYDPHDRRYRYPFTNCTNCGPRYSIIESLPYDRPATAMNGFVMCGDCLSEYEDPLDRRFHAQPNACSACGPRLEYWDRDGSVLTSGRDVLTDAADAIRNGNVVGVKGLGGFHLLVDAANDTAVNELRKRKHREEKPLALMMPSLASTETICEVSPLERSLLESPERPIVILKTKTRDRSISKSVAPDNPYPGCMLPYTPLHHLLMNELGFPVVATSGNLSDEPICIDEKEAVKRLRGIADFYLVHDRPIVRHVDDSIVRVMAGREMIIRRARGFAPMPIRRTHAKAKVLAVGAHLKNTIAASAGDQTFISQHIGDLETPQAVAAFEGVIDSLDGLYDIVPEIIACDEHPDYKSTRFACTADLPVIPVQHHYAHVLSCMAENELEPSALGIAWDGTGYGDDGTIWGGEFLQISSGGFDRVAHFRTFALPGGDTAIREPRRSALGMLYGMFGEDAFAMHELEPVRTFNRSEMSLLEKMLVNGVNSPLTSSVGRMFDAVASIIGLKHFVGFEGQAAMELEFATGGIQTDERYEFMLVPKQDGRMIVDWAPSIEEIITDVRAGVSRGSIAARFHNMLSEVIIAISKQVGEQAVALSGGCFQNKYLLESSIRRLTDEGFTPYWHRYVPTNDGGISLGQTFAADRIIAGRDVCEERRSTEICV